MTKASKLPPVTSLTECPHCGDTEYFVRVKYSGSGKVAVQFDGQSGFDNSGMYDELKIVHGKIAYCNNCEKPIGQNDRGLGSEVI